MAHDRDVNAFDRRAASYDRGWVGEWHRKMTRRAADTALSAAPTPRRVLDVGCGTGTLLHQLGIRLPETAELVGVDLAPGMVAQSSETLDHDPRIRIEQAAAEKLPFPDASFDVVVSTMSFDHWADQQAGLTECARVLREDGVLVLADLFSPWLWPATVVGHRGHARTVRQANRLFTAAGFGRPSWQRIYPLVQVAVAAR